MIQVSQYAKFNSIDSDEDICCLFFTFSHPEKSESEYLTDNEDEADEETLQSENPAEPTLRPQELIHILNSQFEHIPFALILVTFNSVDIVSRDVDESFLMQLKLKWD